MTAGAPLAETKSAARPGCVARCARASARLEMARAVAWPSASAASGSGSGSGNHAVSCGGWEARRPLGSGELELGGTGRVIAGLRALSAQLQICAQVGGLRGPPRRRGGHRAGPEPEDAPTGLIGSYEPGAAGGDYPAGPDPDYRPNSPRERQYSGDSPIPDYRHVSPARPYVDPDPVGGDEDPGDEWDGRVPPPPGGYDEGPPPESFPYGHGAGNERRRRGNPGRH